MMKDNDDDDRVRRMVKREARSLLKVQHPNVLKLYGVCFTPVQMYLVLEFAEKGTLRDVLDNNKDLSLSMRFSLMYGTAKGMQVIHERNILHHDLKTLNVLVSGDLVPMIADFGLATMTDTVTKTEIGGGTMSYKVIPVRLVTLCTTSACTTTTVCPLYTDTVCLFHVFVVQAPETFDDGPYTAACDVYSYSIVCWETVSGQIPWNNKSQSQILGAVVRGKRPDINDIPESHRHFKDFDVVSTMKMCWYHNPVYRPSFDNIVDEFELSKEAILVTTKRQRRSIIYNAACLVDSDGAEVALPPVNNDTQYHMFLSHAQNKGQDQMSVLMHELERLDPDISIFLDIEGLTSTHNLPDIVNSSLNVLLYLTDGVFDRYWVMLEIHTAITTGKNIILLRETDTRHGTKQLSGFPNEIRNSDAVNKLFDDPEVLVNTLFGDDKPPVLEWHRGRMFKNVTLRKIFERMLNKQLTLEHSQGDTTQNVIRQLQTVDVNPLPDNNYHIYLSQHIQYNVIIWKKLKECLPWVKIYYNRRPRRQQHQQQQQQHQQLHRRAVYHL